MKHRDGGHFLWRIFVTTTVVEFCSEIFNIATKLPLEYCWDHHFLTQKPYGEKHGSEKKSMHAVFKKMQKFTASAL